MTKIITINRLKGNRIIVWSYLNWTNKIVCRLLISDYWMYRRVIILWMKKYNRLWKSRVSSSRRWKILSKTHLFLRRSVRISKCWRETSWKRWTSQNLSWSNWTIRHRTRVWKKQVIGTPKWNEKVVHIKKAPHLVTTFWLKSLPQLPLKTKHDFHRSPSNNQLIRIKRRKTKVPFSLQPMPKLSSKLSNSKVPNLRILTLTKITLVKTNS